MANKIKITMWVLSLLMCLLCCKQRKHAENQQNICLRNDWAKDSIGCLHLWTKALAPDVRSLPPSGGESVVR